MSFSPRATGGVTPCNAPLLARHYHRRDLAFSFSLVLFNLKSTRTKAGAFLFCTEIERRGALVGYLHEDDLHRALTKEEKKLFEKLSKREIAFCKHYIISDNAAQSAIAAGYAKSTAYKQSDSITGRKRVKAFLRYLGETMKELVGDHIANADEVLTTLTRILRREEDKAGKRPAFSDVIKAAELLGKRYGLFIEKSDITVTAPTIVFDVPTTD